MSPTSSFVSLSFFVRSTFDATAHSFPLLFVACCSQRQEIQDLSLYYVRLLSLTSYRRCLLCADFSSGVVFSYSPTVPIVPQRKVEFHYEDLPFSPYVEFLFLYRSRDVLKDMGAYGEDDCSFPSSFPRRLALLFLVLLLTRLVSVSSFRFQPPLPNLITPSKSTTSLYPSYPTYLLKLVLLDR